MKPGDAVEVFLAWAAQGRGQPPLKRWFGGYEFVEKTGNVVRVRHVDGIFTGCCSNWPEHEVRLVEKVTT